MMQASWCAAYSLWRSRVDNRLANPSSCRPANLVRGASEPAKWLTQLQLRLQCLGPTNPFSHAQFRVGVHEKIRDDGDRIRPRRNDAVGALRCDAANGDKRQTADPRFPTGDAVQALRRPFHGLELCLPDRA